MSITSFISPSLKESSPEYYEKIVQLLQHQAIPIETDYFAEDGSFDLVFCDELYLKNHSIEKDKYYFINSYLDQLPKNYRKYKNLHSLAGVPFEKLVTSVKELNQSILENKTKTITKVLKNSLKLISDADDIESKIIIEKAYSVEDLKIFFVNNLQKKLKLKDVKVLEADQLYFEKELELNLIVPLSSGEKYDYVLLKLKNAQEKIADLKNLCVQYAAQIYFIKSNDQKMAEVNLWHEYLDQLSFPLALISESGDLLKHNIHFAKLNLTTSKCLDYADSSKITLENGLNFKIIRKPLVRNGQTMWLFVFLSNALSVKMPEKGTTNQDLGIISSSIAHELNNPLAGIMAAISLLSLDDNWSNEARTDLDEMRRCSERSKILVETFLGFSRATPGKNQLAAFNKSLDQAFNLIRFRVVENNIKFTIDRNLSSSEEYEVNTAVFSMIFYLILGELITAYSHHLLINSGSAEKMIKGRLWQEKSNIFFRIQTEFDFAEQIRGSKLIKHLLELEGYQLTIDDHQMSITKI